MKSLQEIIEDLGLYCKSVTGQDANFSIVLPKKVLEHYQQQFVPADEPAIAKEVIKAAVSREWIAAGVCELFSDDAVEVKRKP